jgi:hypothetical protein
VEIAVKGNDFNRDYVSQAVILDGGVYITPEDQHCTVVRYDFLSGKSTDVLTCYEPDLYRDSDQHRLVIVETNNTAPNMIFYDTSIRKVIKTVGFEMDEHPVSLKGNHIELANGAKKYDLSGAVLWDGFEGEKVLDLKLSKDVQIYKDLASSKTVSAAVYVKVGYTVGVILKNDKGKTYDIDYYAENGIITKEGNVFLFTPGGEGIIHINLNQ